MFRCREINTTEEMKMSAKAIEKMQLSDEQLEEVVGGSVGGTLAVTAAGMVGGAVLGHVGCFLGIGLELFLNKIRVHNRWPIGWAGCTVAGIVVGAVGGTKLMSSLIE